jgi:pyruvate dehydrogenase E2 component (dihydrolipoamide acetyltransferase)
MAIKISMPKLSDTMAEGTLVKWRKKVGDRVESSEIIAEAESDKATMELEAYDSGTLLKIIVPEGGKVPVGGTLAIIGEPGEDISALLSSQPVKETIPSDKSPQIPATLPSVPKPEAAASDGLITSDSTRLKASPLARKLAAERKLDLRQIAGTGTGGRIIMRDVVNAQPASQAAVAPVQAVVSKQDRVVPISSMRASIAKRLTQSKEVAPHFYLTMVIDMDKAAEFRANLNSLQSEVKVSFNDMIVKAAARALTKHPYVNGSYLDDKMVLYGRVDIGVAVALEEGLITPVVRNADSRSILEIAQDIRDLARKAKERKLTPAEYSGSTFTISNLGMYDIKQFTAIINPPEAAILAVGAVQQRPVVRDGQIVVGQQMEVTLTCDHRIVDGATGALFLREFKKNLENPLSLMLNN